MSVSNRSEALRIFGLSDPISLEDVRSRYHELVKRFHPDETGDEDSAELLIAIRQAYEYLCDAEHQMTVSGGVDVVYHATEEARSNAAGTGSFRDGSVGQGGASRVLGSASDLSAASERRHEHAVYRRQQKKYEKTREAKKEETIRRLDQASKDLEYEQAMERIHAIRAAEVTAQIIEAMLYKESRKDNSDGK